MSSSQGVVGDRARAYLWEAADEPEHLRAVRVACEADDLPVVGPDTGAALAALAAAAGSRRDRPARALEVGALFGYSALWILQGFPDAGELVTVERDDDHADRTEANLEDAGVAHRSRVERGEALDVLPDLDGPFDLVFLDAAKEEYPAYLDHALRVASPGAVIAADNAFWQGNVWDPDVSDEPTEAVRTFNDRLRSDERLQPAFLPLGDGLATAVVTGP